jgi:hypothetical protein
VPTPSPNWHQIDAVTKHGYTSIRATPDQARTYAAWEGMIGRCYQQNRRGFQNYGGRGITVFQPWRDSFEAFVGYVGMHPGDGYSLDRFPDKNGNYEPGNVRWATRKQQQNNMRSNVLVRMDGAEMTMRQVQEKLGLGKRAVMSLLVNGEVVKEKIPMALARTRPIKYQPRIVVFRGQSMTLNKCASIAGISTAILHYRVVKAGMEIEAALAMPIKKVR